MPPLTKTGIPPLHFTLLYNLTSLIDNVNLCRFLCPTDFESRVFSRFQLHGCCAVVYALLLIKGVFAPSVQCCRCELYQVGKK